MTKRRNSLTEYVAKTPEEHFDIRVLSTGFHLGFILSAMFEAYERFVRDTYAGVGYLAKKRGIPSIWRPAETDKVFRGGDGITNADTSRYGMPQKRVPYLSICSKKYRSQSLW